MSEKQTIGVDIGNFAIKTAKFLKKDLIEVRKWKNLDQIIIEYPDAHFFVSSVGISKEELTSKLSDFTLVNAEMQFPISLDYETPETLGSDRISAAVGAWELFPKRNLLIIDMGTCVTYDLVTTDGVFRGGMISPGLEIRLQAMHQFTNALPLVDINSDFETSDIIGKSTKECIWKGVRIGLNFEIESVLASFNKKYAHLQGVITGGLPLGFESTTKAHIFASSKIVLSGLHAIWKYNEAK